LVLREVATGNQLYRLTEQPFINCVAFSPDGKIVASGEGRLDWETPSQGIIRFWDPATGKESRHFAAHGRGIVRSLAFSGDGKILVSSGGDDAMRLWESATGRMVREFPANKPITCIALSPDGTRLAASVQDGTIRLWDVATAAEIRRMSIRQTGGYEGDDALCMVFAPDGRTFAAGTSLGRTMLWEVDHGKLQWGVAQVPDHIRSLAFSPDGKSLAQSSQDGTVRLYEVSSGQERCKLGGHLGPVQCVAYSPRGGTLASGSWDTTVLIWAMAGQTIGLRGKLSAEQVNSLWAALSERDARQAYSSMQTLIASSAQAVALFDEKLVPRTVADASRMAALLADLDHKSFAVREKAMRALEGLGELIEPELREALKQDRSAEARTRIERLLDAASIPSTESETLRGLRAIEILEHINSVQARSLLAKLAKGSRRHLVKQEAKASLLRLDRQPRQTKVSASQTIAREAPAVTNCLPQAGRTRSVLDRSAPVVGGRRWWYPRHAVGCRNKQQGPGCCWG
jgi:WD40 repeat protein